MTKDEIISLKTGAAIEFLNGARAIVQSIEEAEQKITFQYLELPKAASPKDPSGTQATPQSGRIIDVGQGPIPPTAPIMLAETTTVRCLWIDLINANATEI